MSAATAEVVETKKASLPLPLELTEPVILAVSAAETLEALYEMNKYSYNPEKQVRESPDGIPQIIMRGSTCPGICGTSIGGLIVSERDTPKDD